MKKILLFLIFLFLFYVSFSFLFFEKETTKFVFSEDEFSTYMIDFEKESFTTKTLSTFFNEKNFDIISITPYFSPIYAKKIEVIPFYFNSFSKKLSLKRFEKDYLENLRKLGLKKEVTKYILQGIPIRFLEVYTNLSHIQKLKEKYPLLDYYTNQRAKEGII